MIKLYPQKVFLRDSGFTLIELSIVLVIIGLIIGGVLVGQDLIKAAETRAQITQIEKYNAAVNTFKNKYNGIPGDLLYSSATQFGFSVNPMSRNCNGQQGGRDGNGLIDGFGGSVTLSQGLGETGLFWTDLSMAGLLDADLPNGGAFISCDNNPNVTSTTVGEYFPPAKMGHGNFVYVYETSGNNWYGISAITSVSGGILASSAVIPVNQAYNIDKKIDDGIPLTGIVTTAYLNGNSSIVTASPNGNPDTASTCYNNSTNAYSTNISNGSGPNCALSFKMQGAAR